MQPERHTAAAHLAPRSSLRAKQADDPTASLLRWLYGPLALLTLYLLFLALMQMQLRVKRASFMSFWTLDMGIVGMQLLLLVAFWLRPMARFSLLISTVQNVIGVQVAGTAHS